MTRAYNDIEAVTRLLEEKEKDLELTVQIGKELLNQNNKLEIKLSNLEADLKACCDDRSQLLHDLQKKTELIEILTADSYHGSEGDTPTSSNSLSFDFLQRKISLLQEENQSLKTETMQLVFKTDEFEDHERKLMTDITTQLNETNSQFQDLQLELEQQREENRLQHEQILDLTSKLTETEMQLYETNSSYEEILALLNVTKESQNSLALELIELKERYQEVLSLLQETQQALRKQQKHIISQSRNSFIPPSNGGFLNPESLHSELMDISLYSENSQDSGISNDFYNPSDSVIMPNGKSFSSVAFSETALYKKIFDTVYCGNKNIELSAMRNRVIPTISTISCSTSNSSIMSSMPYRNNRIGLINYDNDLNHTLFKNSGESNEVHSETLSYPNSSLRSDDTHSLLATGIPGAPGAKDLELALRRLTDTEVLSGRTMFSYTSRGACSSDENCDLMRSLDIRTPDSTELSLNTSYTMNQWRVPDKLQIVKPMEGSQTLNHWSKLATPTLSGLLEERPGVKIRGGRGLDELGIRIYTLSDVEEDVSEEFPGKKFEPQNCIYTYITSTVMHPDDISMNDQSISQISSRMASTSTSKHPSGPPTPQGCLSRKNSCSTFSINVGLAAMLNERGIRAVTPAALSTSINQNFSTTVTPRNSPDGSLKSLTPEPGFMSSGMEIMRRTCLKELDQSNKHLKTEKKIKLSGFEKRALKSLRLVEKVENIGLENIISPQQNNSQLSRISGAIARGAYLKPIKNVDSISDKVSLEQWQKKCISSKDSSSAPASCQSSDIFDANKSDTNIKTKTTRNNTLINTTNNSVSKSNKKMLPYVDGKSNKGLRNKSGNTNSNSIRKDLGKVETKSEQLSKANTYANRSSSDQTKQDEQQNIAQAFVGSINSLLFGRKGGWL